MRHSPLDPFSKKRALRCSVSAVSLVELLVAAAVVVLLCALLFPAMRSISDNAKRLKCLHRIRNLGIAAHQYAQEHSNNFPQHNHSVSGRGPANNPGLVDLLERYVSGNYECFYCTDSLVKMRDQMPPVRNYETVAYYWLIQKGWTSFIPPLPQKVNGPSQRVLAMCLHFSGIEPVHRGKVNFLFADGHVEPVQGNAAGVALHYANGHTLLFQPPATN